MNWRQFKTNSREEKVEKVEKVKRLSSRQPLNTFHTLNPLDEILENCPQGATTADLQRMVGESLAAVDREGRPWPLRFLVSMPATDRDRLRELERSIDAAVLNGDSATLPSLLTEWRRLLLSRLH